MAINRPLRGILSIALAGILLAACGGDDSGPNRAPIAVIRILDIDGKWHGDSFVTGETARLSAFSSHDPNRDEISYHWEVIETPDAAVFDFDERHAQVTDFVAETPGYYIISLTVSDGRLKETVEQRLFYMQNLPPILRWTSFPALLGDEPVTLDLSASEDPNTGSFVPFVEWDLVSFPAGTNPVIETQHLSATLTPDGPGPYRIHVKLSDGLLSTEETFSIVSVDEFLRLEEEITDAEYDEANDRIVMTSGSTKEMIIVDAVTGQVQRLALEHEPTVVSLNATGTKAVIGHDGWLSVVDLSALSVTGTIELDITRPGEENAGDIATGGNGYAYMIPENSPYTASNLRIIELGTGEQSYGGRVDFGAAIRKRPGAAEFYLTSDDLYAVASPYDVTSGEPIYMGWASDTPKGDSCGNLWFSKDGSRLITACGEVFSIAEGEVFDLQHEGELESIMEAEAEPWSSFSWLDHSPENNVLAAIDHYDRYPDPERGAIARYDATTLELVSAWGTPALEDNGIAYKVMPRFVFHQAETGNLLVVADVLENDNTNTVILLY